MTIKETLDILNGQEVWTNIFGERTCVGIKNGKVINNGIEMKVNAKQAKELFEDTFEQEFGTRNVNSLFSMKLV